MLAEAFCLNKKPSYLIQKLFMTEAALYSNYKMMFTIAWSSFLLSSTIKVFVNAVKGFQLLIIVTKSSILDVGGSRIQLWLQYLPIFQLVQATLI